MHVKMRLKFCIFVCELGITGWDRRFHFLLSLPLVKPRATRYSEHSAV